MKLHIYGTDIYKVWRMKIMSQEIVYREGPVGSNSLKTASGFQL